ncbi:histidine racemase CntK [Staphylococcus warneri]|uniref:histidine racemase CntK n=1 Tax=Staphylococcus warneri TaxID=1292 RepID=UPI003260EE3A
MNRQVIEFSKYNPSGNMTILVHSQHHPRDYAKIANQLMASTHVCCEQVGFIESNNLNHGDDCRLVMSGNEFCGNATMSYMHYLQEHQRLKTQQCYLSVSGCDDLVPCTIHGYQQYEVGMPQAQYVTTEYLHIAQHMWQAIKIKYESYVHYVIPIEDVTATFKQQVAQFVHEQQWSEQFKTIGIMLFNVQDQYLHPLIYIPEVKSLIWENSCGSGAASIGVFHNYQSQQSCEDYIVYQPGGSISVTSAYCSENGYLTSIKGRVSTVARGQAYIEEETMTH